MTTPIPGRPRALRRSLPLLRPVWLTDWNYFAPTVVSVLSFIRHIPIKCTILCPKDDFRKIAEITLNLHNNIHVLSYSQHCRYCAHPFASVIDNRLTRIAEAQAQSKDVLLLFDSDTVFAAGIRDLPRVILDSISSKPTIWGVVEYEAALRAYLYFRSKDQHGEVRDVSEINKQRCYMSIFGSRWHNSVAAPQLNNGLFAFSNCSRLAHAWRQFYARGLRSSYVNPEDDQVPLAAAVRRTNCHLVRLENRFNSMGVLNGDYAMFHAYAGLWRDEFKAAFSPLREISDYAKVVRAIVPVLPKPLISDLAPSAQEPFQYLSIPGFFEYSQLYNEAINSMHCRNVVEIGTRNGKGTCYMAELISRTTREIRFTHICDNVGAVQFDDVRKQMESKGLSKYVNLVNASSSSACKLFRSGTVDFLFVNGSRPYDSIMADLVKWFPKVSNGGMLAGDFYTHLDVSEYGVRKAVQEFARANGLVVHTRDPCFVIMKPQLAASGI